jgi:hypothetical protein
MSWMWTDTLPEPESSHLGWKRRTMATIFLLLVTIDAVLLALLAFSNGITFV